jgi:hypothetical protein
VFKFKIIYIAGGERTRILKVESLWTQSHMSAIHNYISILFQGYDQGHRTASDAHYPFVEREGESERDLAG